MDKYQSATTFDLPVLYKGEKMMLPAKMVQMGYTYKIFVEAEGWEIVFEPDEERNLRAIVDRDKAGKYITHELVGAIGSALESHLKR